MLTRVGCMPLSGGAMTADHFTRLRVDSRHLNHPSLPNKNSSVSCHSPSAVGVGGRGGGLLRTEEPDGVVAVPSLRNRRCAAARVVGYLGRVLDHAEDRKGAAYGRLEAAPLGRRLVLLQGYDSRRVTAWPEGGL